jgi:MinD superfamily P-loop ATPase
MKEVVVISGKGGTGKTSLVASFAVLADGDAVLADCDVDAPDLHLVLKPQVERREPFIGGSKAFIKPGQCTACGTCNELCRFDAIHFDRPGNGRFPTTFRVDTLACEGCGVCVHFCSDRAIEFSPVVCGAWFVSRTQFGSMVHARLDPGAENSGKLVTVIRQQAQQMAAKRRVSWILSDGSPGIGCPVIASLTRADLALIVVEPTLSSFHDFGRVVLLLRQLDLTGVVVINKADLNEQVAASIEVETKRRGLQVAGRVPFDKSVMRAQVLGRAVVEISQGPAAQAIRRIWKSLQTEKSNDSSTCSVPAACSGQNPRDLVKEIQR